MRRDWMVSGPSSELQFGLSSDRIGLGRDPLVHYWRASPYAVAATTQPRTLCGRRVAFGQHLVPRDSGVCWVCRWHAARQRLISVRQAFGGRIP